MWILVVVTLCWIGVLFEQLYLRISFYPHHPMTDFLWSTVCDAAKALGIWTLLIFALVLVGNFDASEFLNWLRSF